VHYNFACSLSLIGSLEEAFKKIEEAVLLGYDDFSYILKDPDLENLRKHPRFEGFFGVEAHAELFMRAADVNRYLSFGIDEKTRRYGGYIGKRFRQRAVAKGCDGIVYTL